MQAEEHFKRSLEIDPDWVPAICNLALLHHEVPTHPMAQHGGECRV